MIIFKDRKLAMKFMIRPLVKSAGKIDPIVSNSFVSNFLWVFSCMEKAFATIQENKLCRMSKENMNSCIKVFELGE